MQIQWNPELARLSQTVQIDGRAYRTYGDLPRSLYHTLEQSAARFPERLALADEVRQLSFGQFKREVDAVAWALQTRFGIRHGDICAFLMYNSVDYCVCCYAALKLGAIVLPLSTKLQTAELEYPICNSKAKILFIEKKWEEKVLSLLSKSEITDVIFSGEAPPGACSVSELVACGEGEAKDAARWSDGALLMYTSGITGMPKGAYINHFGALHAVESYRLLLGLNERDSTVLSIPITYVTGMIGVAFTMLASGGSIYLHRVFSAEQTARCIQEHQLTFLHGSPTVFSHLLSVWEHSHNAPNRLLCACGSASLPERILNGLYRVVPELDLRIVYGLTETCSPATLMPMDSRKLGKPRSCGIPIPGMEVRLTNCGEYEEGAGELQVRGSTVIPRYWRPSAEYASPFCDGWFDTGDIARLDKDGCLYILDRKKDMINCGGEKVYSIEVENALSSYPAVAECAVTAMHDQIKLEVPCAFVRFRPGMSASAEQLEVFLADRLAKFKLPKRYVFLETFPLGKSGKTLKRQLATQYLGSSN